MRSISRSFSASIFRVPCGLLSSSSDAAKESPSQSSVDPRYISEPVVSASYASSVSDQNFQSQTVSPLHAFSLSSSMSRLRTALGIQPQTSSDVNADDRVADSWNDYAAQITDPSFEDAPASPYPRSAPEPADVWFRESQTYRTLSDQVNIHNRGLATKGLSTNFDEAAEFERARPVLESMAVKGAFGPLDSEAAAGGPMTEEERLRRIAVARGLDGAGKEPLTSLASYMIKQIDFEGPMQLDKFMDMALLGPERGFYATVHPFGEKGHFTTAPECFSLFNEAVGAWVHSTWKSLGEPPEVDLLEMGPGTGRMMLELLHAVKTISPTCYRALRPTLCEASPRLMNVQRNTLASITDIPIDFTPFQEDVLARPASRPLLILANEFFDALPVKHHVKTEAGWREVRVTVSEEDHVPELFKLISLPERRTADGLFENIFIKSDSPRFADYQRLQVGSVVEWSPKSIVAVGRLAEAIAGRFAGAMLVIDYGCFKYPRPQPPSLFYPCSDPTDGAPALVTLRGIKDHKVTSFLSSPGGQDLTADVNFDHLSAVVESTHSFKNGNLKIWGPITQTEFMHRMGTGVRMVQALRSLGNPDHVNHLIKAYERVCGIEDDQMGTWFKVWSVTTSKVDGIPFV